MRRKRLVLTIAAALVLAATVTGTVYAAGGPSRQGGADGGEPKCQASATCTTEGSCAEQPCQCDQLRNRTQLRDQTQTRDQTQLRDQSCGQEPASRPDAPRNTRARLAPGASGIVGAVASTGTARGQELASQIREQVREQARRQAGAANGLSGAANPQPEHNAQGRFHGPKK